VVPRDAGSCGRHSALTATVQETWLWRRMDVLAVWIYRRTYSYTPNAAQAAFFGGGQ
jgi:hypothetical protein